MNKSQNIVPVCKEEEKLDDQKLKFFKKKLKI